MDILLNPPILAGLARIEGAEVPDPARAAATAAADFSSFLNLLTAQLRNQDPLQPLDSTEFVAQLASFSTVEQLIGTNTRLDRLAVRAESASAATYAGWVGREVSLTDGRFRATGAPVEIGHAAVAGADRAVLRLARADGTALREIALAPGGGTVTWDGRDAAGVPVTGVELTATVEHRAGETLLLRQAAEVPRLVTAIRGTEAGPVLGFSDGGSAPPERVAVLRAVRAGAD